MIKSGMRASHEENLPESRQAWTTGATHHFPEEDPVRPGCSELLDPTLLTWLASALVESPLGRSGQLHQRSEVYSTRS